MLLMGSVLRFFSDLHAFPKPASNRWVYISTAAAILHSSGSELRVSLSGSDQLAPILTGSIARLVKHARIYRSPLVCRETASDISG